MAFPKIKKKTQQYYTIIINDKTYLLKNIALENTFCKTIQFCKQITVFYEGIHRWNIIILPN